MEKYLWAWLGPHILSMNRESNDKVKAADDPENMLKELEG